ncbi:PAS domain-containing sensor histidine kinase [Desulfohalovibrio reitneri]|uniref:sensor histidine kinase n=1 Tax=Desulfohalovibrio reitneri TaxID=1307759 RepID=UPI00068B4E3B|nr:PAS domain-containing sensor histidine kinase [Desulfohalovibrio reitneri]
MSKPSRQAKGSLRDALIGLGERSVSKSHYPQLKEKIAELEQFRTIMDLSSDVVFLVDGRDGRITDVTGDLSMLDASREKLLGRPITGLLTPKGGSRFHRALVRGGGTVRLDTEASAMRLDGREIPPLEMNVRVVSVDGRRLAVASARDVTAQVQVREERERAHHELERKVDERTRELRSAVERLQNEVRRHAATERRYLQAKEKAEEASRAKSEFLSVVSHELRTPLTAIRGFAQIITRKLRGEIFPRLKPEDEAAEDKLTRTTSQVEDNLDIITQESHRLTGLIDDLLDISSLEAGRGDFKREAVDMAEVIRRAGMACQDLYHRKGLPLELEIAPEMPYVLGDFDRLIQVLVNLLTNAAKFTNSGGVSVHAWSGGDHVLIAVSDTGEGIPDDKQEGIFEKFVQARGDSMKDRPTGTGLGLAISRQIVLRHGGDIWVESLPERGSTFFFSLPTVKACPYPRQGDDNG